LVQGVPVPWMQFGFYTALLIALAWCFLGIGMLVSSMARTTDVAQGLAFVIWLLLLLFLDLILLGILIQQKSPPELVVTIALLNPMQVFRTAAMLLFDPQLVLLGPAAYVILDNFGKLGYIIWALVYPVIFGSLCASLGYWLFKRGDLP
ncbi:ABC transporter permease subunit, partial [Candidatus Venteria ishoeyi]